MATSRRTVPTFVYICGIPKTFSVKQDANSGISIELHMAMETSIEQHATPVDIVQNPLIIFELPTSAKRIWSYSSQGFGPQQSHQWFGWAIWICPCGRWGQGLWRKTVARLGGSPDHRDIKKNISKQVVTSHRLFGHCIRNTTPQTTPLSATSIGSGDLLDMEISLRWCRMTSQRPALPGFGNGCIFLRSGMKMDRTWKWWWCRRSHFLRNFKACRFYIGLGARVLDVKVFVLKLGSQWSTKRHCFGSNL